MLLSGLPRNRQSTLSKQAPYCAAWWSQEHVYIIVCICQTSEDLTVSSVISLKAPVPNTLTYSMILCQIPHYSFSHNSEHLPAQHQIFITTWLTIFCFNNLQCVSNLQERLFKSKGLVFLNNLALFMSQYIQLQKSRITDFSGCLWSKQAKPEFY